MASDETAKLTPLQKAVAALERLRSRLARLEDASSAPIAIVGIGCRFPGGVRSPEDFWQVLSKGVDAVTQVPASRWNASAYYDADPDAVGKMYTRQGAFVDAVDEFDAEFFGISAREAEELDPRQRLLLETSWEALERAGIVPRALEGSRTGVFIGIEESDYGVLGRNTLGRLTAYTGLGRSTSTAAGRLSYVLGLQGPCVALNTACSASLVALHFACQSLRVEECRLALAGGVALHLSPLGFIALSRTHALAPDGRCKTFSARANGYGRGEGCGMVVLKRLSDAQADGDQIVAVIRGSAVAHDGTSSGLTVPNGSSQRQVLGDALGNARLEPRDIQYVECHGTGTALGDPIEVHALGAVYGVDRPQDEPLLIGTAKTNIGHLEAAAGVAGLLKVVLSLQHAAVPPSLHFDRPNPHIEWSKLPVEVVTALRPWPARGGALRAGVSAFGISGTNAHVIVEARDALPVTPEPTTPEPGRLRHLIVLSAKNEAALRGQAGRLAARLEAIPSDLGDVAQALATRRSAFRHRLAFSATDTAAAIAVLQSAAAGTDGPGAIRAVAAARPPSVAFMITGQGAQYAGMSRGLYETEPVFRRVLDRAAEQLSGKLSSPLLSVLFPSAGQPSPIDDTAFTQPAMFAVCYSLAMLFRAWGVEPAYLIGHSIGEYVAACLAGVFSFEDALRLVAARGRLMQALPVAGAMMSIEASEAQVAAALARHEGSVSIAAINGPRQVVIAGNEAVVSTLGGVFASAGIRTKRLRVSHAFHSPLMRPMIEAFRAVAESVSYARPRIPLVSNVTGGLEVERFARAAYWTEHVLLPVRMDDGLRTIRDAGVTQLLEIGPSPVLCGLAAVSAPDAAVSFIPSLRRDRDDTESLLESLARLWTAGVAIDWAAFDGHRRRRQVSLPTYAFQRQRYWLKEEQYPLSGVATSGAVGEVVHELLVGLAHQPYLGDHIVHRRAVVPGAFYLSVLFAIAADRLGAHQVTLRDIEFVRPLITDDSVRMQVRLAADHRFTVASDVTHMHGTIEVGARVPSSSPSLQLDLDRAKQECAEPVSIDAAYAALESLAISWGPAWRWMTEAYRGKGGALVRLAPPSAVLAQEAPLHPCVIDNGFGAGVLSSLGEAASPGAVEPSLPYAVAAFRLHRFADGPVWCLSKRRPDSGSTEIVRFDLVFWDDAGALIAEVDGFAVKRAPIRAFFAKAGSAELPLFGLFWRPAPLAESVQSGGRVGVFAMSQSDPIASMLAAAGADVVAAPRDAADLAAWLDRAPLDVLVCVWGTTDPRSSLDAVANERAAVGLHILQAVLRARAKPRRLLWVTTNATALDEGGAVDPASATLWGLGRVAAQEHPELALRLVDLHDRHDLARRLFDELAAGDDEPQIALGAKSRFALRLDRMPRDERSLSLPNAPSYRLVCDGAGGLNGLLLEPCSRRPPADGEVEVEVEAAGLNFRDVVNVLRMVADLGPLGGEISGVVTAVGAGVPHLAIGDGVMGLAAGGFSKYVTTDARWLVARPAALSPEQAAAWPVVFLTAWIALRTIADIRLGERVLIHSAAGGVGMAAIQLAQLLGAEVYATASPAKWDAVRGLGVPRISSSRTLGFVDDLRAAGGVDVVINTLAGEFVDASLSLLRPGGRFVELGKTDLRAPAVVSRSFPGIRYEAFDLAKIAVADPAAIQMMLVELTERIAVNELKPLPLRVWPIQKAPLAFEHMARAAHIGKIVLVPDGASPPRFRRDGSALITGGLGALGLEVARWLVQSHHVSHIVLAGRRVPSPEAWATIAELQEAGTTIEIAPCDVADLDALRALLATLPPDRPLRVVIHAAGVLDDGVITEQTADRFAAVLAPKVSGAWNLHRLTEPLDLDAFVLFSSISGWLGSAGQSNYAAANAFLDALAAHRRARGLVATAIAWGAWSSGTRSAGLGMTARLSESDRTRLRQSGLCDISPSLGVALLAAALDREHASIGAFSLDLGRLGGAFGARVPPLLRGLIGNAPSVARVDPGLAALVRGLSPAARLERVQSWIAGEVSRVMRTGSVPLDQPLQERGLDSLMAVEVRNGIAAKLGKPLPVTLLFDYPTIAALSHYVLAEVLDLEANGAIVQPSPAPAASWSEPIAIVGIGCRFPGGVVDPESFWKLLEDGVDAIGEVPPERWDVDAYFDPNPDAPGKMYTRWGGFLPMIDRFDAGFFGISGREARSVDPQERLMLEVSWEALERARLTAQMLMDSATGVYMGVCNHEYSVLAMSDVEAIDAYSGLGTAHSAMVGRISYSLGLRGPNIPIDTACSSSLVAVHLACQALRAGECRIALAGGVNTILFPEGTVYFSRLRAMSPTGRCRPFSALADGYVRSEGIGVVVLERLSDAQASGREILAVIRGTAVNQDGRSQGPTAPSGPAQQAVIRRALENAGIAPHEVDYVECHGTGTPLGDPIELHALAAAYGVGRLTTSRLAIGSVKGNLGHTEGAAGIAGLIKAVLLVQRGELPKSLHAAELNPHIPWDLLPLDVVQDRRQWPQHERPRRAGVSAFGFSGTNAHVILEQAPKPKEQPPSSAAAPASLTVSAKSAAALRGQAAKLARYLAHPSGGELADVAHALRTDRSVFWHRLAIEAGDRATAAARLATFASEGGAPGVWAGEERAGAPEVAFLFTGQGAQYVGMGRGLYEGEPVFRAAIDRCAALFARELQPPLVSVLHESGSPIDETACAQPALFAVGYALAELWKHWGVAPSAVLGHSIGEYAAAQLAGVFSLEDAVRLVAARGRLMQALPARGAMVMIGASEARILPAIAPANDRVSIAAINGPEQVVISGDEPAVLAIAEMFAAAGVRTRRLRVSHAFHSPLMAPMLDAFHAVAKSVAYVKPATRIVSTAGDDIATAEYWVEHVRAKVHFFGGLRALLDVGVTRFLELGPAPILSAIGAENFPDSSVSWLASLRQDHDDVRTFRESAARLWISGVPIAWQDLAAASCRRVTLPTYAFERERYWLDARPSVATRPGGEQLPSEPPRAVTVSAVDLTRLSAAELGAWVRREVAATLGAADPSAVSPSRELFEQGFDSLLVVELRSRLSAGLGRPLPLPIFFQHRTVDALTAYLAQERTRVEREVGGAGLIVPLATSPLLFLFPGALGASMDFFYLGQCLMPEWTVFGLDYPGVNGGQLHTDIRTLASALAEEIARFAGDAPIAVGGHSFGGGVAWEVCHELLARGRAVELVLMFDTFCPLGLDGYAELEQAAYVERLERLPSVRALFAANSTIAKNWRTSSRLPADVCIVQFKVPEKDSDAMKTAIVDDPRDVWADYAAPGTYTIEQVPGTHSDFIVRSPGVDEVARRIKTHLAAVRDRVTARITRSRYGTPRQ